MAGGGGGTSEGSACVYVQCKCIHVPLYMAVEAEQLLPTDSVVFFFFFFFSKLAAASSLP